MKAKPCQLLHYQLHKEEYSARSAAYYRAHSDRIKDAHFIRKYGESRQTILARYPSRCGCCGTDNPGGKKGWNIDHDHGTNKIRGILCSKCNTGIGKLGDSVEGLERALAYLRKASK